MIHRYVTRKLRARALEYVLGFLPVPKAAAVEAHLEEGCRVCAGEIQAHRHLVDLLGERPSIEPPRELRDRLLARIQDECRTMPRQAPGAGVEAESIPPGWTIVRAAEGKWMADGAGRASKVLRRDDAERGSTLLVWLRAGGVYPGFIPAASMELYLIEGDLCVNGECLFSGDYCAAAAGTLLADMESRNGCEFIVLRLDSSEMTEAEGSSTSSGLVIVRAAEGSWLSGPAAGVTVKPLFRDPVRRTETYLVRAQSGSRLPRHRHLGPDETFFLEGDGRMGTLVLQAGDYYRAEAGTIHEVSWTERGCLCLTLASVPNVEQAQE